MSFRPIYEGWDIPGRLSRSVRGAFFGLGLSRDQRKAAELSEALYEKIEDKGLASQAGRLKFVLDVASRTLARISATAEHAPFGEHLAFHLDSLILYEGWFALPDLAAFASLTRSELWQVEDQLKRVGAILDNLDRVEELASGFLFALVSPLVAAHPKLISDRETDAGAIRFEANLRDLLADLPTQVERALHLPFSPELEPLVLFPRTRDRLEYNLVVASGGVPGDGRSERSIRLPTKQSGIPPRELPEAYLGGTPLGGFYDYPLAIELPSETRFAHHHIVAGSGHGKTQTLQHLILHDLESVAKGEASIVVIDSQSDLIGNIAGLKAFAPGEPLHERLVNIDPTDIEYPVALNLFDVGQDRLTGYSPLERERLTNSILELYDFVLGSLLEAGMTQKQTVIFRYITRLLLHIPGATIHTLRELLEDGGFERYEAHIKKLKGSARAFFENEFQGKEFTGTKRQVLRRLYGILENQTFERMFSHQKSKLDLFAEMNAGKVILINTAKELLKENGTEIFGRFFIALIAQAAQERATLKEKDRLPIFVYVDEASDYFDENIGAILSQARKYKVGMVLSHQYLGQLSGKLEEAIAANTAIKFAGGVSAKDARALASELRTDAEFIERQPQFSFAAFIKGETKSAVSLGVKPGTLEARPRMNEKERDAVRARMRARYAVPYEDIEGQDGYDDETATATADSEPDADASTDDGKPQPW